MGSDKAIRVFHDATAIVTGGASGIGRALAEELAKRGGEVVLADRQIALAEQVATEINASRGKARAVELDVVDFPAVDQLVRETMERTGRLDYIFNNAGIGIGGTLNLYNIEDWNLILDINLKGVINGVQAAYNVMLTQGFGHIVNTASLAGIMPCPGMVSYATTKHGVLGLSTSLRAEAASLGIRVSVLCPGVVRTAIFRDGGEYGKMLMDLSPEQERRLLAMFERFRPIDPNVFAEKALRCVAKNRAIIVVPSWWKLFWWINRLFPNVGIHLAQNSHQKTQKELGL